MQSVVGNEPDIFEDIETLEPYSGYYFSIRDVLLTCLLGSICGLRNVLMIWKWANAHAIELSDYYNICIPSRSQFYLLLSNIDPDSMKKNFAEWVSQIISDLTGCTVALDGKTIRSTEKMAKFERPLHIVTAFVSELGMTIASEAVDGKTNEIPTAQMLLKTLEIKGSVVVADAMHCQTETAQIVIQRGADYLLSVKNNQPTLKRDIEEYVQDDSLRSAMETAKTEEKNGGRFERRTAFITNDITWMEDREKWAGLNRIGAICIETEYKGKTSLEWHYFITSKDMSAAELLYRARAEWAVESLHWMLDVHFNEDHSLSDNEHVLENLNIIRKTALNLVRAYRDSHDHRESISGLMANALFRFHLVTLITAVV
jgi:predicted transposase YbfD/YdcC